MNAQFLSTWVDNDNKPVNGLLDFTQHVLSIPRAHQMVMQYSVLDEERRALILMRPYQIHAIEAVQDASRKGEGGYIWHTTGSGKTLTSYKVARNLLQIPSIDKTIFVVDRTDLDQQTTSSFASYAANDMIDVNETEDTKNLVKQLASTDKGVVITTIQKIQNMLKQFDRGLHKRDLNKIKVLRVAFIVDECHRAVTPGTQRELQQFFINSLWYGFTGTPIFEENKRQQIGDLPQTTEEQYGDRLHTYTVKEAIHDRAVLGFQIEYQQTFDYEEATKNNVNLEEAYEDEVHMLTVLKYIINQSRNKFGFTRGVGQTYNAILTVKSIAIAQKYYDLIKGIKEGKYFAIDEQVKKVLPDFPKVAITYSVSENEEDSTLNQDKMKASISDYNQEFGTNFHISHIKAYNEDINHRLARKKDKFNYRAEQLDLVIVVNRLLTGFDAPCMSTLFIDRPPMRPQDLIQAFSRTNRLFDNTKRFGQIVTFQSPTYFKAKVDEALKLYSNGGENFVKAPSWEEARADFTEKVAHLFEIAPSPHDTPHLESATDEELQRFAKAFQQFDRSFTSVQVYLSYDEAEVFEEEKLTRALIEEYAGKYHNIMEELKRRAQSKNDNDDTNQSDEFDVTYELESVHADEINYQYILSLIQGLIAGEGRISSKESKAISQYIDELAKTNPRLAHMIQTLWLAIGMDPKEYEGKSITNILDEMIDQAIDKEVQKIANAWAIGYEELRFLVDNYVSGKDEQIGETELNKSRDYQAYKESMINQGKEPLSNLKYRKEVRPAYTKIIEEIIEPLQRRR